MTPDRWLTLTVRLAEAAVEAEPHLDPVRELVPQLLLEVGGAGVEESSDTFTTYLPPPEELDDFLATVRSRLNAFAPGRGQLEWGWQPHEDWEELWRQGLGPRRITPRIVVAPTWDTPVKNPGEILITLDPGMAFGTAEHATTRGCLRLLDGRVQQDDRVADIGSGSGILSIAAVHLGAKKVLAVELIRCPVMLPGKTSWPTVWRTGSRSLWKRSREIPRSPMHLSRESWPTSSDTSLFPSFPPFLPAWFREGGSFSAASSWKSGKSC